MGGYVPVDVIFVLLFEQCLWASVLCGPQITILGHGNLRLALPPVLPGSCWQMASQSCILPLPPRCRHYPASNELLWLYFSGGQEPRVACQVYSGWGQRHAQGQKRMHTLIRNFANLEIIDKIVSWLRKIIQYLQIKYKGSQPLTLLPQALSWSWWGGYSTLELNWCRADQQKHTGVYWIQIGRGRGTLVKEGRLQEQLELDICLLHGALVTAWQGTG